MPRQLRPPKNLNQLNWFFVDYEYQIYTLTLPNKSTYSFDVSDYNDKIAFQEYLKRELGGGILADDEAKQEAEEFVDRIMNNAYNFGTTIVYPKDLRWARHLIER